MIRSTPKPMLAAAILFCSLSVAIQAFADPAKDFAVPAGDLVTALQSISKQADVELLFDKKQLKGARTKGAKGTFTSEQVIRKLLEGTNFEVSTDEATGAMMIGKRSNATADSRGEQDEPGIRVAQERTPAIQQAESGELEEVIVTAQKREERLIDVPISIVALSADELQKREITSLDDLPSVVPGLAISPAGGSGRAIEIRGISNTTGTSSLIGMYIDEADATLGSTVGGGVQLNPNTYDLERVEVLRGPQGTLYGEGSAGGTIRFITHKPDLTKFSFAADVASLFTQDGAPSERINAVVNLPLIENQLGLRIVGTSDRDGGWINQPAADQVNINGQDVTNLRVIGLWQPTAQFTANVITIVNRIDRGVDVSDPDSPANFTQVFSPTTTPRVKNDSNLYNITLTYDSAVARVLSTSTYIYDTNPTRNESNYYQETPPGTTPYGYYIPIQTINDRLFTQELRLTSVGAEPWQWTIGAFYRHYNDSYDVPVNYFGLLGPPGTPLPESYADSIETLFKSESAYADTSYKLWDRVTIGVGGRYFREDQTFAAFAPPPQSTQSGIFHSTDPRAYAQYKVTDNFNLYAGAAKGFRSGGFNALGQPSYSPESVWTYELGTKMSLLDEHVRVNTDVFWSNYTGYQTYGVVAGSPYAIAANVGDARIKGVEWDLTFIPKDHWSLGLRGDYLDARFTEIDATETAYAAGDPIDLVPRFQFTVSAERDFSWSGRSGFARLDYNETGRETYRARSIGPWYSYHSGVIHLLSLHTSLNWTDHLRFGIFADNLLNDQGFANPYANILDGVRSRPRTVGLEFGVTY